MSNKNTVFYRGNTAISVDFSAEEISSDGSLILLEKLERRHKLLRHFSKFIPDTRDPQDSPHPGKTTETTGLFLDAGL